MKRLLLLLLAVLPLLGRAQNLTQADFTGVLVPQYTSNGNNNGATAYPGPRLATVFRATLTNLTPSTTYRYYVQAAQQSDIGTTALGAGVLLLINPGATPAATTYATSPTGSLSTAGSYASFTTDATGTYTGWFGFVNSNNARFQTPGTVLYPAIVLATDAAPATIVARRALNQGLTVLAFATAGGTGTNNGTLLTGSSQATPKNLVFTYDNVAGTGRPLSSAVVEAIGIATGTTQTGTSAYTYSTSNGDYTTVVPNILPNGVRRVEQRSVVDNSLVGCASSATGTWPSGVNTVNPSGGTTALVLTATDTPLNTNACGSAATPAITATPAGPLTFTTVQNAASATQTVTVGGSNLTAGVTVTASAGYEVSLSATTGFAASVTVPQTSGTAASTPVYVRLASTATAGAANGTLTVASTGATNQTIVLNGTVSALPTITSLSPSTAVAGAAATTLTVNGTGFVSGATITFNGTNLTTTFVSATQLTATIPAASLTTSGAYNVTVTNPASGGTSAASTFTVTSPSTPAPTITSFSPTSGVSGTTVTLTGTNFTGATAVTVNGVSITGFTVVSPTSITFTLPATATSGPIVVTTPGGSVTSTGTFTVNNPAPTITSLTPSSGVVGSAITVTITGTGFLPTSTVTIGGTASPVTYVSPTQLTVTLPATATAGSSSVIVTNPTPGGGSSTASTFVLNNPTPTITSLAPATAATGAAATLLTVNGTGFVSGATISFNGTVLTTTFVSATQLTATIPAASLTTAGTYNVIVTNPAPSVAPSAASTFTVTTPSTGTVFEDFEAGTKAGYATGMVMLTSGSWTFTDALIGTTAGSDKFNGAKSARIRGGGVISMDFDKPNGAGVITVNAAMYGTETGASFKLEISTDGGTTYTDLTSAGSPTLTGTLTPYTFTANLTGNVRLRISSTNTMAGMNPRINIDDIGITNFSSTAPTVTATPGTLTAFTTTVGTPSATQRLTIAGTNLSTSITVTAPAGYEVSTNATTGFASSVTVAQTGGTAGNTQVYVRLAGTTIGTFGGNVTVASTGATTVNVPVTGTVTATPAAPTITSFSPTSGASGTTVTITGTNLTGATSVTVNGVAITGFTVVSPTSITFTLPATATSGPIVVTTPGGTVTSTGSFTVTAPAPTISSFTPGAGPIGSTVLITGTNFTGATTVRFNGVVAPTFTVINPTTISVVVPAGATSGVLTVVTPGGTATSTTTFRVGTGTRGGQLVGLELYPNPVQDVLHVVLPAGTSLRGLQLRDALGRVVLSQPAAGPLDLRRLPQGLYLLELRTNGDELITRRVVKQ